MRGRAGLGATISPPGARAILLVTDHSDCHSISILHKSHMTIADQRQYSCHKSHMTIADQRQYSCHKSTHDHSRSKTIQLPQITHDHSRSKTIQLPPITDIFSAFAQIKVFKKAQLQVTKKKKKKRIFQKLIFVPATASIFFQSLVELKMKFLKLVLFQGSGSLHYRNPKICIFTVVPSTLKLGACPLAGQ